MSEPRKKRITFPKFLLVAGCVILGMVFMCVLYYGRQAIYLKHDRENTMKPQIGVKIDTIHAGSYTILVTEQNEIQIKAQNEQFDEKVKSLNDRMGDLYLSLTIIVALLLVFNIGVFFNARHEAKINAEEYLSKHLGEYSEKAKKMHDEMIMIYDETMTKMQSVATEYKGMVEIKKQKNISTQNDNDGKRQG
jgi:hypothetical protein